MPQPRRTTRSSFAEAVACYRAGAYRAAIVATWTAVTFDYIAKLRDLDLAGNQEAGNILTAFENARQNAQVDRSLELEREILDTAATKFDLLTPLEKLDLERLKEDRNRCAHPSLQALDEPYSPSAELVRSHLRNAVEHLLSRPPVQGREALDRIWGDISSEYFPDDPQAAEERLRLRLSRARETLVRKLLVDITKELLDGTEAKKQPRLRAALLATISLFHQWSEKLFREKLPRLAEMVEDPSLHLLVRYCRYNPLAWPALGPVAQGRLQDYTRKTSSLGALCDACHVPPLFKIVLDRPVDGATIAALLRVSPSEELLEELVKRYETETSFGTFRDLRDALRDDAVMAKLSDEQLKRLVRALHANEELGRYGGFYGVVEEVLDACKERAQVVRDEWLAAYGDVSIHLAKTIREVFPDFPERADANGSS